MFGGVRNARSRDRCLEASSLTYASRRGLLARRSTLLRLQGDEKLVALVRDGSPRAFDALVDRYHSRLLGFCRQMLGSTEDAEDVLQEVFVNAYRALLADNREINLRPWLYRIARNRCLNHLRKPTADGQESMDGVPAVDAASTHERVHNREEFRQLISDVGKLPETQRSALLLREMDALSYEDIATAMETTVPSVKSLLVRARISLAEASQARQLTCGEVRLELAAAAEGLSKASGPIRRHVRECEECGRFRSQVRSDAKVLAALSPIGPLLVLKGFLLGKLGLGGGAGAAGSGAASTAGGGTLGAGAGALGASATSGAGAVGGILGVKAVAGVVTAAVLTAGAVEVNRKVLNDSGSSAPATATQVAGGVAGLSSAAPEISTVSAAEPAEAAPSKPVPGGDVAASPTVPVEAVAEDPAAVEAPVPAAEQPAAVEAQAPAQPAPAASTNLGGGSSAVATAPAPQPQPSGQPVTAPVADSPAPAVIAPDGESTPPAESAPNYPPGFTPPPEWGWPAADGSGPKPKS